MTNKIKQILQHKFLNADGTLNKTVLVSAITLLIVLVDQILAMFDIVPAHQDQAVAILNTILTILSLFGFVEGPSTSAIINPERSAFHGKLMLFCPRHYSQKIVKLQHPLLHQSRPV